MRQSLLIARRELLRVPAIPARFRNHCGLSRCRRHHFLQSGAESAAALRAMLAAILLCCERADDDRFDLAQHAAFGRRAAVGHANASEHGSGS